MFTVTCKSTVQYPAVTVSVDACGHSDIFEFVLSVGSKVIKVICMFTKCTDMRESAEQVTDYGMIASPDTLSISVCGEIEAVWTMSWFPVTRQCDGSLHPSGMAHDV